MTAVELLASREDEIFGRIEGGESQSEISRSLKIDVAALNRWLRSTDQRSARAKSAMSESAESWLDRGLNTLIDAPCDQIEIARARAITQECARRAAIRNPAYRERSGVELTGANGGPIRTAAAMSDDQLAAIAAGAAAKKDAE